MRDFPRWVQVLVLTIGELLIGVVGIPLYVRFVMPAHPTEPLPGIIPVLAADVHPAAAIALGVVLACGIAALFYLLYRRFGDTHFSSPEANELVASFSIPEMVPIYVAAGIAEEFLFRGVLVDLVGVVIAALLFAALHIPYWKKPMVLAFAFGLGLVLGFYYVYTRSLLLCAILHAAYNLGVSIYLKQRDKLQAC